MKQYQYGVTLEFIVQAGSEAEALDMILSNISVPPGHELYTRPHVSRRREFTKFISLPIKKEAIE